jgi:hypothetical protein
MDVGLRLGELGLNGGGNEESQGIPHRLHHPKTPQKSHLKIATTILKKIPGGISYLIQFKTDRSCYY